ncbi:unnamed protein product [Lymnaea stagnalis]|uniref:RBR-type E3 ubiquitin transferase n=1 Tax=Lymnaea stagnalis TaxID=6523 RepID=A0AAV2HQ33_LYMST
MVYKVCKGGVRSGNTLRGLRTLQSKRYARQGCVIGRSSLGKNDVNKLLEHSTDDNMIQEALGSTNVILSLNKKQRWRIPATVGHMIKTGCFDHKEAQVSLLERHKLKRRANCVSFVSNRGRYAQVVPKQKRYFSFNLNRLGEEQSKRFLRRERVEALKKAMATVTVDKKVKQVAAKTVNVFTIDGVENGIVHSSKPEYRLEVFYPCPQSCSLTFNPKYTDVVMEMNEEGKMEIRSNTNKSKKKRKHRKRLTNKDVQEFQDDLAEDEDGDFWYAADEPDLAVTEQVGAQDHESGSEFQWVEPPGIDSANGGRSEDILSFLVAEALKAKSIFGTSKVNHERKPSRRSTTTRDFDSKSHIVYTNEKNPRDDVKRKQAPAATRKSPSFILYKSRTILTTVETSPENLKEKFGHRYSEAACTPRRFVINVTEDVVDMISAPTLNTKTDSASYLVFLYDGFYDDGLDTFKVTFNSQICHSTKRISEAIQFQRSSIGEILKTVISILLDMKQENQLNLPSVKVSYEKKSSGINFIQERMKVSVEALSTCERMHRLKLEEKLCSSDEQYELLTNDLDQDLFCEICYEDVNVSHHGSVSGLGLNQCGHNFCDNCMQIHVRTKINNGHLKMKCPGYQCDSEIGPVTLMTLIHVEEVNQIIQREMEEELEGSPNAKWCPNPKCGRIIKVISEETPKGMALDVMCQCGTTVCFSCLSPPHWPAKCDQAENYIQRLATLAPPTETAHEETENKLSLAKQEQNSFVIVEGRLCPGCEKFVEKDGGCNHMVCKCGFTFCWNCMTSMTVHDHGSCHADPKRLMRLSRRLLVRHVTINNRLFSPVPSETGSKPRQKATMYQKAMKQRLNSGRFNSKRHFKDLAANIDRVAFKDLALKRELLSHSGADKSILDLSDGDLLTVSVAPHVIRLLHDYHEFKLALHRVSEFTFVLIQDTPVGIERRRALKLANDIGDYCSFIDSIFEMGSVKDPRAAVKRLLDIKEWARRALDVLLATVEKLRS